MKYSMDRPRRVFRFPAKIDSTVLEAPREKNKYNQSWEAENRILAENTTLSFFQDFHVR